MGAEMTSKMFTVLAFWGMAMASAGNATHAAPIRDEQDGQFLAKAVEVSRQGVSDARAASQSARSADIQEAARSIADDHGRAIRKLTGLAKEKGMELPRDVTGRDRDIAAAAEIQSESDPDRIAGLLKAHENAVALFHQEVVRGTDPELRKFAQLTLPTLQRRLVALRSLQDMYPPDLAG
jgi:putative membrane protein